jgi:hypothetical protein
VITPTIKIDTANASETCGKHGQFADLRAWMSGITQGDVTEDRCCEDQNQILQLASQPNGICSITRVVALVLKVTEA